jgi:tetratricopeptide (TPR) repeat protein
MKQIVLLFLVLIFMLQGCIATNLNNSNKRRQKGLNSGEYTFIRGINLYQKGKKQEALEEYLNAYKKTPKNVTLLKEIALLYGEFGNYDKAIEFFLKAFKLSDKDIDIQKNLSYLYYLKKDYVVAKNYLDKISGEDQDEFILKIRGYIEKAEGNLEKAYEYFYKIDDTDYDKKFYDEYIELCIELNKKDELFQKLSSKYEIYNNEKSYLIQYAKTESSVYNRNNEAIKKLLRYIAEYDGDDELYLLLTNLYININDYKNANNSFKLVSESSKYTDDYRKTKEALKNHQ